MNNEPLKPIRIAGYVSQVAAIVLLLGQFGSGWFAFANTFSSRLFVILMFVLASFGNFFLVYEPEKVGYAIKVGLITLAFLLAIGLIFGSIGLLDASDPTVYENNGLYFALDSLTTGVLEIGFVVQTIARLIPTAILLLGIITIYVSDSGDELQSGIIEIVISIGIIVLFYFFGNQFGFTI